MCTSSPDVPEPQAPQDAKQPDVAALFKAKAKRGLTAGGGTLLTSPSGVAIGAQNMAAPTLLGG